MLRELQQKKNHGQVSQCEFPLYCGEVANNTADFLRTASSFMVKNGSVLAVRKSKPVQTGSLKGAGFPGEFARASLKLGFPRAFHDQVLELGFPGEFARASLKRAVDWRFARVAELGSLVNSPGLH